MASYRFEPMSGVIAKGAVIPLGPASEWPALATCAKAAAQLIEIAGEFRQVYSKNGAVLCSIESVDNVYVPKRPYVCAPSGKLHRPASERPEFRYFQQRLRTMLDSSTGLSMLLTQIPISLRRSIGQIMVCGDALYLGDRSFMFTEGETKQSNLETLKSEIAWSRIARVFVEEPSAHELIAWETPLLDCCPALAKRLEEEAA